MSAATLYYEIILCLWIYGTTHAPGLTSNIVNLLMEIQILIIHKEKKNCNLMFNESLNLIKTQLLNFASNFLDQSNPKSKH